MKGPWIACTFFCWYFRFRRNAGAAKSTSSAISRRRYFGQPLGDIRQAHEAGAPVETNIDVAFFQACNNYVPPALFGRGGAVPAGGKTIRATLGYAASLAQVRHPPQSGWLDELD